MPAFRYVHGHAERSRGPARMTSRFDRPMLRRVKLRRHGGRFFVCPGCGLPHELTAETRVRCPVNGEAVTVDESLPPPPRRAAQVGDRIALRYRLTSVLGAGALGRVFRGMDEETNRFVAIKVLHENARTPQNDERFMREARLLTDLNAPGVVDVSDYGIDSGAPFLVMEIVQGSSLSDVIAEGELPIPEAVRIAGEVLDALVPVHERGFVHRDIKPGNVMLREDRSVCLLDFGMSRRATGTGFLSFNFFLFCLW